MYIMRQKSHCPTNIILKPLLHVWLWLKIECPFGPSMFACMFVGYSSVQVINLQSQWKVYEGLNSNAMSWKLVAAIGADGAAIGASDTGCIKRLLLLFARSFTRSALAIKIRYDTITVIVRFILPGNLLGDIVGVLLFFLPTIVARPEHDDVRSLLGGHTSRVTL